MEEEERLKALYRYNILDTPREEIFDDVSKLLAYVCKTPVAIISFVDRNRQWFKSEVGLGIQETGRDVSFCSYAIQGEALYLVNDTHCDPIFQHNRLVTDKPGIRFYAGSPLFTLDGFAIGTVSVIDFVPRDLDELQIRTVEFMARQVMAQLELRRVLAEQEQLLQREQKARNDAEQANRQKDQFLVVISHELRTPINAVLGWAQLLKRGLDTPEKTTHAVEIIEQNSLAQGKIIEDLLDLSRIESGKIRLDTTDIELDGIIDSAIETVKFSAEAKHITINHKYPAGIRSPKVNVDPARFQQIIWNLLTNAIKFTPPYGAISVIVESDDAGVTLGVQDTGRGIKAQDLPHVFERFYQDDTQTPHHGGLGLGLAIVKQLTELHGGNVTVESEGENKGTYLKVTLPPSAETAPYTPRFNNTAHKNPG